MQSTVVHMCDHEVEIELDAERSRLTRVEQRMISGGSNDERLTDVGTTSFVPTSVSPLSLLPPTVPLHS